MSQTVNTTKTVTIDYNEEGRVAREVTTVVEESVGFAKMDVVNVHLFQFSEWLDSQGLILPEAGSDRRTHEELVRDFLASDLRAEA